MIWKIFQALVVSLFIVPVAQARVLYCRQVFQDKTYQQDTVDELFTHIHLLSMMAPHRGQMLEEIGISPQIVYHIGRLFETLSEYQRLAEEAKEINQLILDPKTNEKDSRDLQEYQQETQVAARVALKSYREQRQHIVNFIKVHLTYPQFDGVFVDITRVEGPAASTKFMDKLLEVYEAYAFEKGWRVKIQAQSNNSTRLLIRSEQALAFLIGESGIHSWNTNQGEFGKPVAGLLTDGSRKEKRRMVKMRVEVSPFVRYQSNFNISDVRLEAYNSASGPGGQRRNKVSTDVRALHIPTGIVVEEGSSRHFATNKKVALEKIEVAVKERQRLLHDEEVKRRFLELEGIDGDQVIRFFHLKEGLVGSAGIGKINTSAKTLDEIKPHDLFGLIQESANTHFSVTNSQRLQNLLNHVLAVERELKDEVEPSLATQFQEELFQLLRASQNN